MTFRSAFWFMVALCILQSLVYGAGIQRQAALMHQILAYSDSLATRNRCLEASGVDCTEPMTVGGDKLPYGRRP